MSFDLNALLPYALVFLEVLGVLSAVDAIMTDRSPQSSAAWALGLVIAPIVTLPLYWLFGRARFRDYQRALKRIDARVQERLREVRQHPLALRPDDLDDARGELRAFEALTTFPLTRGNGARLLIDGTATFDALFEAIRAAERYVLVQFYILHDDALGERFRALLEEKARAGVRVQVLYDALGSWKTSYRYWKALRRAGAEVSPFPGTRYGRVRGLLRINFRNHRKVVVVDGRVAFVGGFNVGDEYLGLDPNFSPWRDTHVQLEGPVVQAVQLSFLRDWSFCTGDPLGHPGTKLEWTPTPSSEDRLGLVYTSGPDRPRDTAEWLFTSAIHSAEHRVWIATPYFIPDAITFSALRIAAMRGVDVRVLIPKRTDSLLSQLAAYAYLADTARAGIQVLRYEDGFLHEKAFVVDEDYAAVMSANFDNRSFRLNFEITALFADAGFARDVAAMLERDFARACPLDVQEVEQRSFFFRLAVRVTRLLAPAL